MNGSSMLYKAGLSGGHGWKLNIAQHHMSSSLILQQQFSESMHHGFKVECNKACQRLLRQRQREGYLHDCEIHPDVRTFSAAGRGGSGVSSGFPCQAGCSFFIPVSSFCAKFQLLVAFISC